MAMIEAVEKEEYQQIIGKSRLVFNDAAFHELNKNKVDRILYLLYWNKKYKAGMICGVNGKEIQIPYSAPFGFFESIPHKLDLEDYGLMIEQLEAFARGNGFTSIYFKLPPLIYGMEEISKASCQLQNQGYAMKALDLNYYMDIKRIREEGYLSRLTRAAKKNLNIALKNELSVEVCQTESQKKEAYDIIALNRAQRGYPLRMSYDQVLKTTNLVESEFFLVRHKERNIASALVYYINGEAVQVVYWGHDGEYGNLKPINYLAYYLVQYYEKKQIEILDIGPSTEEGKPNLGLCSFKEGIGCSICPKLIYWKELGGIKN